MRGRWRDRHACVGRRCMGAACWACCDLGGCLVEGGDYGVDWLLLGLGGLRADGEGPLTAAAICCPCCRIHARECRGGRHRIVSVRRERLLLLLRLLGMLLLRVLVLLLLLLGSCS